jgi:cytochrome b-561
MMRDPASGGGRRRSGCCGGSQALSSLLFGVYVVVAALLVGATAAFMRLFSPLGFKYQKVPGPPALPYMGLNTNPVFAWHPILLTIAYAALMGSALLSFTGGLAGRKPPSPKNRALRKNIHASLHALAGVFIGLGLAAVFTSQKAAGRPLFYTGHSWVGIGSIGLYALNFIGGFASFLLPCTPGSVRKAMLPFHNFVGWLAFGTGLQAIASGIEEMRVLILTVYMPTNSIPQGNILPLGVLLPLAQVLLSALIATALAHAMLTSRGRTRAAVEGAVDEVSGGGGGKFGVGDGAQQYQHHDNGLLPSAPAAV